MFCTSLEIGVLLKLPDPCPVEKGDGMFSALKSLHFYLQSFNLAETILDTIAICDNAGVKRLLYHVPKTTKVIPPSIA